jgi:hypothetical protein
MGYNILWLFLSSGGATGQKLFGVEKMPPRLWAVSTEGKQHGKPEPLWFLPSPENEVGTPADGQGFPDEDIDHIGQGKHSASWTRSEFDSVDLGLDTIIQVHNPLAADTDLIREGNQHGLREGWTFAILGFIYQDAGDLVAQAHEYVIQSMDGSSEFIEFLVDLGSGYFNAAN